MMRPTNNTVLPTTRGRRKMDGFLSRRPRKRLPILGIGLAVLYFDVALILLTFNGGAWDSQQNNMVIRMLRRKSDNEDVANLSLINRSKVQRRKLLSNENWMSVCSQEDEFNLSPVLSKIQVRKNSQAEQRLKIFCFVNSHEGNHDTKVRAVRETWGSRCDKLVIASNKTDESMGAIAIPNIADSSYENLWNKHRETLRYIWDHYQEEYEWFFKADDDTYAIIENLKAFLASPKIQLEHNRGKPLHIGNPVAMYIDETGELWDEGRKLDANIQAEFLQRVDGRFVFNVGGAGYVINKPFLANMIAWIDRRECAPARELSTLLDDAMISVCSSNFGIVPYKRTRDKDGRERFHQESPSVLYTMTPEDELYQSYDGGKRLTGGMQVGDDCCSARSVTFHHMSPNEMYAADEMLYFCRQNQILVKKEDALRSADYWPPYATVLRIADDRLRVIVLLVNCAYLEFVDNQISSMLQFHVTNFVLVPLDEISYRVLLATYPDNVVPPYPDVPLANADPVKFNTSAFIALNTARPLILQRFAESGFTFLYIDADMYWRSNILPILDQGLIVHHEKGKKQQRTLEAILLKDGSPEDWVICSCLMYMQPTDNTIDVLAEWNTSLYTVDENDQPAWNAAVTKMAKRLAFRFFDGTTNSFPSGLEYFYLWDDELRERAHLVHNNWIIGSEGKKERFEKYHLWKPTGFLEQVSYRCRNKEHVRRTWHSNSASMLIGNVSVAVLPPLSQRQRRRSALPAVDNDAQENRTLVILLGNVRGGETTWRSLYRNLLDPNHADLALMLGFEAEWNSSLYRRAKYVWGFPEYQDWGKAIDELFGTSANDTTSWREIAKANCNNSSPFSGTDADPVGGGVVNNLARWFLRRRLVALNLLEQYDRFVITRTDQYYTCGLDLSALDASKIWVPTGEDWYGICDRFVVCSHQHVLQLLNILEPAVLHPGTYYRFRGNIETFVKLRWTEEGLFEHVRRFRRSMFTASLESDHMRWLGDFRKAGFVEDGTTILFKYEDEYYQAMSCFDYEPKD